jgi:hypothetical protein
MYGGMGLNIPHSRRLGEYSHCFYLHVYSAPIRETSLNFVPRQSQWLKQVHVMRLAGTLREDLTC